MSLVSLLVRAGKVWFTCDMKSYAAAFSYYAPIAIIPLLVTSISIVGIVYGEDFTTKILSDWGSVLGKDINQLIKTATFNLESQTNSYSIPLLATIFFLFTSIITLNVLATGFHKLGNINKFGLRNWLIKSLKSTLFIIIFQAYLILIIGFEFFLALSHIAGDGFISVIFLFFSTSLFFALLFRYLASNAPSWSGCIVGAVISGTLFVITKSTINLYINSVPSFNLYGTAGLILILLIWIYVLAAIIFYGASIAYTYDKMRLQTLNNKLS